MKAIVTGGAGFIGSNLCARLMEQGHKVVAFDNLSRKGALKNLSWLQKKGALQFVHGDIRDHMAVFDLMQSNADADLVVHLAAQVAVTTSVADPRTDFEINLLGSLNVLEAIRSAKIRPFLIFSSTNKVYGKIDDLPIADLGDRYAYDGIDGISETRPLDFYSPYGCSKGGADQYIRDYSRIYNLPTCVFRMSCIYGPRQFGVEDQGWVAWFVIAAILGRTLNIYGDGKQVRDVLHVSDLVDCYLAAYQNRKTCAGRVFNAGGGPANTLSLLELIAHIEKRLGKKIPLTFGDWRPGDQKIYVSDITLAKQALGWTPQYDKKKGVDTLIDWVSENTDLFKDA